MNVEGMIFTIASQHVDGQHTHAGTAQETGEARVVAYVKNAKPAGGRKTSGSAPTYTLAAGSTGTGTNTSDTPQIHTRASSHTPRAVAPPTSSLKATGAAKAHTTKTAKTEAPKRLRCAIRSLHAFRQHVCVQVQP